MRVSDISQVIGLMRAEDEGRRKFAGAESSQKSGEEAKIAFV